MLTDMEEVLPLLRSNYVRNVSPSALRGATLPPNSPDSILSAQPCLVPCVGSGAVFPLSA